MKNVKKIIVTIGAVAIMATCSGCNKAVLDTHFNYNTAIIALQNGEVVEGKIKSWKDFEGEQLQIVMENGDVYLTSSYNCTLINRQDNE